MKKKIIIISILTIILTITLLTLQNILFKKSTDITLTNIQDNLYKVVNTSTLSTFDLEYQQIVDQEIQKLLSPKYTMENPLMILNPYGTNTLGLNIYFTSNEELQISYTVSVDKKTIPDFSQTLKNEGQDNFAKDHQYQIIGLVLGEINNLNLVGTNRNGENIECNFQIDMTVVDWEEEVSLRYLNGESKQPLADGLFVHFRSEEPNNIYDNEGILRASLPLAYAECHRILFYNDNLYYKIDENVIAVVNRLGKIINKYEVPTHRIHHDYILDAKNEKIIALTTGYSEQDTRVGDMLVFLDMKTGNLEKVIDMKDLLPEMYEIAEKSIGDQLAVTIQGIDWMHLNSITLVEGKNDIIISSRETSSIIYLQNIYEDISVKYIISEKAVYENTEYEGLVYKKIGDFVSQASQHTVEYISDSSLKEGQYYLIMFNNNFGENYSRKDFPWNKYPGAGTYVDGEKSMYYKYLVDENAKTYELVEAIDVYYSSTVSSVQIVGENLIIDSGNMKMYEEYDKNNVLIKAFQLPHDGYGAYRVFKYDFKGIWFK